MSNLNADQFHAQLEVHADSSGYAVAKHPDHGYVGEMVPLPSGEVGNIEVKKPFRRLGVATRLWEAAHDAGATLTHSPLRTPAGDRWAKSVGGDLPPKMTTKQYEQHLNGGHR